MKIMYLSFRLFIKLLEWIGFFSEGFKAKKIWKIEELVASNKSVIRWGDGETRLLMGGDINFQRARWKLSIELLKVLLFSRVESNYVLGLPIEYISRTDNELKTSARSRSWIATKYVLSFLVDKNLDLFDAFVFREETNIPNELIEKMWLGKTHIIFVHGNYKYFNDFKNKYVNSKIYFVQVPSCNAFDHVDETLNKIIFLQRSECISKDNLRILVSAGPSAKTLIRMLSSIGMIAYDMGHYFDYKFYDLKRDWKDSF